MWRVGDTLSHSGDCLRRRGRNKPLLSGKFQSGWGDNIRIYVFTKKPQKSAIPKIDATNPQLVLLIFCI